MIRELTKSAVSFSWVLSLLGIKQAVSLLQPAQQGGSNLIAPVIQIAVNQLDDSMKNIYRSGDSLQSRMVDLAFVWINPVNWINPKSWTDPFGGCGQSASQGAANGSGPQTGFAQTINQPNDGSTRTGNGPSQNTGSTQGNPPSGAPVSNDTAAVGWGPMPADS
jgi:hypothetical protein